MVVRGLDIAGYLKSLKIFLHINNTIFKLVNPATKFTINGNKHRPANWETQLFRFLELKITVQKPACYFKSFIGAIAHINIIPPKFLHDASVYLFFIGNREAYCIGFTHRLIVNL